PGIPSPLGFQSAHLNKSGAPPQSRIVSLGVPAIFPVRSDGSHGGEFAMKDLGRFFWLALGLTVGAGATFYFRSESQPVWAGNDRSEDYIMTTGPISLGQNVTVDGIWVLDYRAGKLLGT